MALITCPECKNQISEHAESCPNCGYRLGVLAAKLIKFTENQQNNPPIDNKNLPKSYVWKVIGCVILFFIFVGYGINHTDNKPSESKPAEAVKVKTPEEQRKERIEHGFSAWDGSHRKLEELIKQSMNDPDSYKHDTTKYIDRGDYLVVITRFRGKNAFGAMMPNTVKANCDLDGNVLEVISQELE